MSELVPTATRGAGTGRKISDPLSKTYLLAANEAGEQIVSVHVKRCYRLHASGRLVPAEGEIPLLGLAGESDPRQFDETDIIPFKQRTDLILMTKAWGRGQRSIEASIRVGPLDVRYRVQGERRVIYRGRGSWAFSEAEPFESIEMRYENAYGGFDTTLPDPPIRRLIDLLDLHPGEYPRNPIGKGYIVRENPQRLDGLLLPNLEHPTHRLTPTNLLVGEPENWWRQPLPWSCNWFPKHCYPRVVHYRGVPAGLPENDTAVPEVRLGWLEPSHARRVREARHSDPLDGRFADAASPALITPLLRGNEAIELTGFTPEGSVRIQLPDDRPHIILGYRGHQHDLAPVLHRVLISTLEMGVYLIWHAGWLPPTPLPRQAPRPDDTMATWLEGVDVHVDGSRIAPLGEGTN